MNAPASLFADIRAVIIDLDGTMLHTAPDFLVAINAMRAELQLAPVGVDVITRFVGKGTENLVRSVLGVDYTHDQVAERYPQALEAYMRHYTVINGRHSTVYPGVAEGVRQMQEQGLRLACVTNKPIAFTTPLLASKGLAPYFEIGECFRDQWDTVVALRGKRFEFEFGHAFLRTGRRERAGGVFFKKPAGVYARRSVRRQQSIGFS